MTTSDVPALLREILDELEESGTPRAEASKLLASLALREFAEAQPVEGVPPALHARVRVPGHLLALGLPLDPCNGED